MRSSCGSSRDSCEFILKGGEKMNVWVRFFVGTPQRFLASSLFVALVVAAINPDIVRQAVSNMMAAIAPLMEPALTIAIVIGGIRFLLGMGKTTKK